MNIADANRDRYAAMSQVAVYLEAEWSDILFDKLPSSEAPQSFHDPRTERVSPAFYRTIVNLTDKWLQAIQTVPVRYCDVGGATGRTLYEFSHLLPSLTELVLVEPASALCDWARRLLLDEDGLGWIPVVGDWQRPSYAKTTLRPVPVRKEDKEVWIYQAAAEEVPRPAGYFDLITSLNVVDRHSHPVALVETLRSLLRPSGLLVLSSPMEFEDMFTPDRERWVRDLNELFLEGDWNSVGESNVLYDIRLYSRKWSRYSSHVVAKQKHG